MLRMKFMKTGMGYVVPTQLGTSWRRKNINFHGWRVRILGSRNIVTYLCSQRINLNPCQQHSFRSFQGCNKKKASRHQFPQHLTNENQNQIPRPGRCWWFRNPAVCTSFLVGDFSYQQNIPIESGQIFLPSVLWILLNMSAYVYIKIHIYTQNVPSRESCCLETWIQKN